MKSYKCEVKTGVIFRRVCDRFKSHVCSQCAMTLCFEHTHNRDLEGQELCPDCYAKTVPEEEFLKDENRLKDHRLRDWTYYRSSERYLRYNQNDEFDADDYAAFDQINNDGSLEMDDSYDS